MGAAAQLSQKVPARVDVDVVRVGREVEDVLDREVVRVDAGQVAAVVRADPQLARLGQRDALRAREREAVAHLAALRVERGEGVDGLGRDVERAVRGVEEQVVELAQVLGARKRREAEGVQRLERRLRRRRREQRRREGEEASHAVGKTR